RMIGYGTAVVSRAVPVVANQWQHMAVRLTSSSVEVFWNGLLVGSASTGMSPSSVGSMRVWAGEGSTGTVARPFLGKGADLCFWNYLADADIAWLANPANNILQVPTGQHGFPLSRLVN